MPSALPSSSAQSPYTKLIIRDVQVDMSIGIYDAEKQAKQPVLVNLEATVQDNPHWREDDIRFVVSYECIVEKINELAKAGHIDLVETMAEYIAEFCLEDDRVFDVTVRIEKPEIFACAAGVGVEIHRTRR